MLSKKQQDKGSEKPGLLEKKRQNLLRLKNSAFELFAAKGIEKTSVDEIVKKSALAKGTFYLYFKDKADLIDRMVLDLSGEAVESALAQLDEAHAQTPMDMGDSVVFFAQKLIDFLQKNPHVLPIVHKSLSRGLAFDQLGEKSLNEAVKRFTTQFVRAGGTAEEAQQRLYMIVELANSVVYNALVDRRPYTIEAVLPVLFSVLRKMVLVDDIK